MARRILATSALPNANGPIHLGHMLEHIQTDIWVRFQRMRGHEIYYVCADDTHGTATMIRAEAAGIAPEELIEGMRQDHLRDFNGFDIVYDNYYSTHSDENRAFAEQIFERLQKRGLIFTKHIEQLYDPEKKLFLADRFVIGTCPKCGAQDQYGDNCEACAATYSATDLRNARSVYSGAEPELREAEHYFFDLAQYTDYLKAWTRSSALQQEVSNKLSEWLEGGLKAWDISRDAPYFGFLIPGTLDKYFYVWMDAPIGYMASFKNFCDSNGNINFDDFWNPQSNCEVHHFIGKDIINFHALFWPSVLDGADFRTPTRIHTHGFITVNGTKMSKSRGTFITAADYLRYLSPDYLRYYYATKLNGSADDIDINLEDFVQRVNSDLVGKVINIASRCAGFLNKRFEGQLAETIHNQDLWRTFTDTADIIAEHYERGDTSKAVREVTALADLANQYIAEHAPWQLNKDPDQSELLQLVCSQAINMFRTLAIYLAPVLPSMAKKTEAFLNVAPLTWQDVRAPLRAHRINNFSAMLTRMDIKTVDALVEASAKSGQETESQPATTRTQTEPTLTESTISIEDFDKIKLKVARIIDAQEVQGADKLLQLTLDVGDHQRQVFSGIREAYAPQDLIGRLTIVVANLAPRTMRFGVSQGMILAAGPGGSDLFLLNPDTGATPGMDVG
jgi:methionyl-tRNA synthetase